MRSRLKLITVSMSVYSPRCAACKGSQGGHLAALLACQRPLNPLNLNLDLLGVQVDGVGRVQLARAVYNFTDTQDVRVVLGYRMHVDKAGRAVGVRP